jgi:3-hydroxyisobutyrate dehydrogenase-like beta-hydroxyacid dehydrogenase
VSERDYLIAKGIGGIARGLGNAGRNLKAENAAYRNRRLVDMDHQRHGRLQVHAPVIGKPIRAAMVGGSKAEYAARRALRMRTAPTGTTRGPIFGNGTWG